MEYAEHKYLHKLIEHASLNFEESHALMQKFLSGDFNTRLASSILSIIAFKGEQPDELAGFATALTEQMKKFNSPYDNLIDLVGTGDDHKNAFNISTISGVILSMLGVKVAKQVRLSTSSGCASGDILKFLGVNINAEYDNKKICLEQENIVVLSNQDYYNVLEPIKNIESELKIHTVLSALPVICHPAKVKKVIIGTPDRIRASLIAKVLEMTGIDKAYVLWNEAGYDEIVPIGLTRVFIIEKNHPKKEISLTANDFALSGNYKVGTPIKGGTLETNLQVLEEIDNLTPGIALDTVIMNTALGLRLSGAAPSLKQASEMIKGTLKQGDLRKKIERLAALTN
jgi:anthranilate phosphoribosyltransferase